MGISKEPSYSKYSWEREREGDSSEAFWTCIHASPQIVQNHRCHHHPWNFWMISTFRVRDLLWLLKPVRTLVSKMCRNSTFYFYWLTTHKHLFLLTLFLTTFMDTCHKQPFPWRHTWRRSCHVNQMHFNSTSLCMQQGGICNEFCCIIKRRCR